MLNTHFPVKYQIFENIFTIYLHFQVIFSSSNFLTTSVHNYNFFSETE